MQVSLAHFSESSSVAEAACMVTIDCSVYMHIHAVRLLPFLATGCNECRVCSIKLKFDALSFLGIDTL